MAHGNLKSYLTSISHSAGTEMAGSNHTLSCCLSKPRNSLEAGKKQPRGSLEYDYNMSKVLLYPSFRDPLVLLLSPYGDSEMARNRFLDEPSGKAEREEGSKVIKDTKHR